MKKLFLQVFLTILIGVGTGSLEIINLNDCLCPDFIW